jgi:hypothetical protein
LCGRRYREQHVSFCGLCTGALMCDCHCLHYIEQHVYCR